MAVREKTEVIIREPVGESNIFAVLHLVLFRYVVATSSFLVSPYFLVDVVPWWILESIWSTLLSRFLV